MKSVSNFVHGYDTTQQCARGAAKPQGSAKVTLSIVCIWGGRSPLLLLVMNNEHIFRWNYFLKWCDSSMYTVVQQLKKCHKYFERVWIIIAQVYNNVPCGESTLVCHNFERLLPAQALWSFTAHVQTKMFHLNSTLQHIVDPHFISQTFVSVCVCCGCYCRTHLFLCRSCIYFNLNLKTPTDGIKAYIDDSLHEFDEIMKKFEDNNSHEKCHI